MTFPYFKIPPELYENLSEVLEQGGFDAVWTEPDPGLPEGYSAPENPSLKLVVVRQGECEVEVSGYFDSDPAFGYHKSYVLDRSYPRGMGAEVRRLKLRVEKVLEDHGAVRA